MEVQKAVYEFGTFLLKNLYSGKSVENLAMEFSRSNTLSIYVCNELIRVYK